MGAGGIPKTHWDGHSLFSCLNQLCKSPGSWAGCQETAMSKMKATPSFFYFEPTKSAVGLLDALPTYWEPSQITEP